MATVHQPRAVRLAGIAKQRLGQTSTSGVVAKALAQIDSERVSSLPSIVESFAKQVENISSDRDLSESGKRSRIEAAASSRLGSIAGAAREIAALEREHATAKSSAVQLGRADAADMLLDLKLAEFVQSRNPIPTVLVQMSERIRVAVARLPAELSGITPEVQARVVGSLISNEMAARFEEEAEVLSAARAVVQAGIDELATAAGWSPRELVQHFGTSWKLPGVSTAGAENVAARLATEGE
jgi:hypothetical protein